jgi:N-acetylglucosaminyldiphosphoundecaprenol N-acetyl-beta-D-mannosaminyltransferase
MLVSINAARPDILWVGFGAPKQERWIHENLGRLQTKVAVGVGGAFDMASGAVRRAPPWMQRSGLEWFHRFLMEPRRMFRRYFIDAMPFVPLVVLQRLAGRAGRRPRRMDT